VPGPFSSLESSTPCYEIESLPVAFGDVLPGEPTEKPNALAVRVFSERNWSLRMGTDGPLVAIDGVATVPSSRLEWRTRWSGSFEGLRPGYPVVVARGAPTTGAGEVVLVDLRLSLDESDALGNYGTRIRLELEY
jgi:hypothetical protein